MPMSDAEKPLDLWDIARELKARKGKNSRVVLCLGARVGGFMQNPSLYDTAREYCLRNFDELSHLQQFSECYRVLTRPGQLPESELHKILDDAQQRITHKAEEINMHLAELIEEGICDEILSTSIDDSLEKALLKRNMQEQQDFEVFIPRDFRYTPGQYNDLLEKKCPYRITKIFGDLTSRQYSLANRRLHLAQNMLLKRLFERILKGEILAIGLDPVWDEGIFSVFPPQASVSWFLNEGEPVRSSADTGYNQQRKHIVIEGGYTNCLKNLLRFLRGEIPADYPLTHDMRNELRAAIRSELQVMVNTPNNSTASDTHIADVLLITVTEVEAKAVLDLFPHAQVRFIGERAYHDLGTIGNARTLMIQSWMGAGGPGGSLFTVAEGIRAVSPSAVVMVGIAFGLYPKQQHIGDILVSQQLLGYDLQRVSTSMDGKLSIHARGDRVSASVRLADRFRAGKLRSSFQDWAKPPGIEFGLVFSGSKLIDNQDFRDQLRSIAPEAIGGEMEGAGLYDAAHRYKVDWILVKAICDWADGKKHFKKEERQKLAAENAARFVIEIIQQGGFVESH